MLPEILDREKVGERLRLIFAEGTPNYNYCTRELAASTVFTMLYIGAIDGFDRHMAPKHVYRMTKEQSQRRTDSERMAYADGIMRRGHVVGGERWYEDNTRESIRDETLRQGLVPLGAAIVLAGIPTTSSKPRYALNAEFAALFDPKLDGQELTDRMEAYRTEKFSAATLARISILRSGAAASDAMVPVQFPNGEARNMAPGLSSVISKAVVEEFSIRFLVRPAVLWLSESGNKVVAQDDELARTIGLAIDPAKELPDIILADIVETAVKIVFVEVVATDGPMSDRRKSAIAGMVSSAGFAEAQVAYVTAYSDRDTQAFKKTVPALSWGTYAWFASEPDKLIILKNPSEVTAELI